MQKVGRAVSKSRVGAAKGLWAVMSFSADVSKFVEKTKIRSDLVVRKLALDCLRGAMLKSPVDTGRFRASWRVGIEKIDKSTAKPTAKKHANKGKVGSVDPATLAAGTAVAGKAKFGQTIYITNNVIYALPLENGHSKQAPKGIMKLTAQEVFGGFVKTVKAVANG